MPVTPKSASVEIVLPSTAELHISCSWRIVPIGQQTTTSAEFEKLPQIVSILFLVLGKQCMSDSSGKTCTDNGYHRQFYNLRCPQWSPHIPSFLLRYFYSSFTSIVATSWTFFSFSIPNLNLFFYLPLDFDRFSYTFSEQRFKPEVREAQYRHIFLSNSTLLWHYKISRAYYPTITVPQDTYLLSYLGPA
jgi:hypothetical protein